MKSWRHYVVPLPFSVARSLFFMTLLNILITLQIPSSPSRYTISSFCVKLIKVVKVLYSISFISPRGDGEVKLWCIGESHKSAKKPWDVIVSCRCSQTTHAEINPLLEKIMHIFSVLGEELVLLLESSFLFCSAWLLHAVASFVSLTEN